MVILLQGLLLERSEEALDNQTLLKVATLMRVLKGCTDTFEQLEKELDGLMEGDMRVGKSNVGKWMWRQCDIVAILRNLDSHKLTLSLILDILNCHQEQQERRALQQQLQEQKDMLVEMRQLNQQQNALLLNVIMGNSGTLPIRNIEQLQSNTSIAESVTSRRHMASQRLWIQDTPQEILETLPSDSSDAAINMTNAVEIRSSDQPIKDQQLQRTDSCSSTAPDVLVAFNTTLDTELKVDIEYEQILSACRVYKRIRTKDFPSNLTLSEINISSRSVLDFRFKQPTSPLRYTYNFIRAPRATLLASHVKLNKALISAAKQDSPRIMAVLLERGADIDAKDVDDATPLHWAASADHVQTTSLLLSHGADINAKTKKNSSTPLHWAVSAGHIETTRLLLSHGVDTNARNGVDGLIPLHWALWTRPSSRLAITKLLLDHGADVNLNLGDGNTALHIAAMMGHVETAKLLLSHGADVNVTVDDGKTPLHLAALKGHVETTKLLLSHGAEVNLKMDDGKTPLHLTALSSHVEIAMLLLGHGAGLNLKMDEGKTPLHLAALNGHAEVAKLLLSHGAEVNLKMDDGKTPLHLAALKGHVEITKLLLGHEADVNPKKNKGGTPLHLAAMNGHVETTKLLLSHGADTNVKAKKFGSTPLHSAVVRGRIETTRLLLSHGADVDLKKDDGETPLHSAARSGQQEIAEVLLAHGADISVKNELNGETPIQYATRYGYVELKDILVEYQGRANREPPCLTAPELAPRFVASVECWT